ncbi:MAG: BadF/BadG/BcrA/BcrD ATPase family protein [Candidatus Bathyarchaeia archaeon]
MNPLIIGIDVGATTTKAVALEGSKILTMKSIRTAEIPISTQRVLEKVVQTTGRGYRDVEKIAVSGGGAKRMGETLLKLSVMKVDEIRAIGLGGLALSGKKQALIVSMGTGTALVVASEGGRVIKHIGGTGVGGGTIEGLSKWMLNTDEFRVVEEMAERGDAKRVDLTVADIAGGPVGMVPAEATASNFGRLTADASKDDVAAAIFNMVSQVVGVVTAMAAKAYNLEEDVVLVGKLIQSKKIAEVICEVAELFKIKLYIPPNSEYCVAVGAAKAINQSMQR